MNRANDTLKPFFVLAENAGLVEPGRSDYTVSNGVLVRHELLVESVRCDETEASNLSRLFDESDENCSVVDG